MTDWFDWTEVGIRSELFHHSSTSSTRYGCRDRQKGNTVDGFVHRRDVSALNVAITAIYWLNEAF